MLLIDINSYFATLLQQENPFLRGKPVAIVKDLGRTCVIAASKEAKKLGIKTGTNIVQARQLAPDLLEVKAEFDLYLSATKKLIKLFQDIAPDVCIYSLDEAFIDVTHCQKHLYPDLHQLGYQIQDKIKTTLGEQVTANVGIGSNRLLAKMAAEISPKGSVFEINQDNLDAILAEVSFEDVCGIGFRLASKLARMGVFHPYQVRFYSVADLEPLFGPFWSRELLKIAYGEEPHHLQLLDLDNEMLGQPRMKTVSRSITMWELVKSEDEIKRVLYNLTQEVIYKVRKMKMSGRQVGLSLYGSDFLSWGEHQTFKYFISHTQEMFKVINDKLSRCWHQQFNPIKFRVYLGLLKPNEQVNPSLLPSWQKQELIETAVDQVTDRYGLFSIRSGLLLDWQKLIKPEVTGFLGDKSYQLDYR